jgi:hypothetical protein
MRGSLLGTFGLALVAAGAVVFALNYDAIKRLWPAAAPLAQNKTEAMPDGAVIISQDETAALLRQCSREAPSATGATWTPSVMDIRRLEALLPVELAKKRPNSVDWSKAPVGWLRQYGGITRNGRRIVYGNYLRPFGDEDGRWRKQVEIVCDGGPNFFGVEYDADLHRIVNLSFNGSA